MRTKINGRKVSEMQSGTVRKGPGGPVADRMSAGRQGANTDRGSLQGVRDHHQRCRLGEGGLTSPMANSKRNWRSRFRDKTA